MSQNQSESTTAQSLLAELANQLQTMQPSGQQVSAVSIKLPEFWTTPPEIWFAKVEAQFGTRNITHDSTKYDYVVSALDFKTAEEVHDNLVNRPAEGRYESLKKALIKVFGKSQAQRDNELLNLNGLGDKNPTALLRKINSLNDDPKTLKRAFFLSNLPEDVRKILAGQDFADLKRLAGAADRVWEARLSTTNIHNLHTSDQPLASVEAITIPKYQPPRRVGPSSTAHATVCYYHTRFGPQARNCQPGCKFASLLSKSGNGKANR